MGATPEQREAAHNKGQEDASEGKFDAPVSGKVAKSMFTTDSDLERDKAYRDGYHHAKSRK